MDIKDFKKFVQGLTETDFDSDEPHISQRCEENEISKDEVIDTILHQSDKLVRIVKDRPNVYKFYYKMSKHTELKVFIEFTAPRKILLLTVKKLTDKFRLGRISRKNRF